MRVLFTIPHYYNPKGGGFYGSLKPDPKPRANALAGTLFNLHATFGARRGLLDAPGRRVLACAPGEIDVVVCTSGEHHLLDKLPALQALHRRHPTKAEPRLLGFECHGVLRESLGRYDYYCYMEDDL